jgi:hypothetical protein
MLALVMSALAQDPAGGWMAYAVGKMPSKYARITRLEMTWTVGKDAKPSKAFYSPWFGMDPDDDINLCNRMGLMLGIALAIVVLIIALFVDGFVP